MTLDRRGFLKFLGGVSVGAVATPIIWQTLDDVAIWSQNWSWIPRLKYGENTYHPTMSKLCPSGVGLRVRQVAGRPVRALGNENNPLSLGGISPLAAAEVQLLHSPSRVQQPLKRSDDGAYIAISWAEAGALLKEGLASAKGSFTCISGDYNGTMNELLSGFSAQMGSADFFLMPHEAQAAARAWDLMGGQGQIGYDVEKSDFILALGANVLESWGTVVRTRRLYSKARPHGAAPTMQLAYVGPVQNGTAAGADFWVPARAGSEALVALGIAHLLIKAGASSPTAGFSEFRTLVAPWTPEKVAAETGVDTVRLKAMVAALQKARRPLVMAGSALGQGTSACANMAAISLNILLGSLNTSGCIKALPHAPKVVPTGMTQEAMLQQDVMAWLKEAAAGKQQPKALLFYEANPLYALPQAEMLETVMKKASFTVAFASHLNETALQCKLILPLCMGLERLDDIQNPYGCGEVTYGLALPVCKPAGKAQDAGTILLALAAELGLQLGVSSVEAMYKAKAAAVGADWKKLQKGEVFTSDQNLGTDGVMFRSDLIAKMLPPKSPVGMHVAPVYRMAFGTSVTAIPPFNTKLISNSELVGKDSVVQINGATAQKLGLQSGDMVRLKAPYGTVRARLNIYEGVMPDTLVMPVGFGHTAFDAFSKDKGANIMSLYSVTTEPVSDLTVWTHAGVDIAKA